MVIRFRQDRVNDSLTWCEVNGSIGDQYGCYWDHEKLSDCAREEYEERKMCRFLAQKGSKLTFFDTEAQAQAWLLRSLTSS